MRITVREQGKEEREVALGFGGVGLYNFVSRLISLLGSSATNVTREGDALCVHYRESGVLVRETYHEFFSEEGNNSHYLFLLKQELFLKVYELKITGFEDGVMASYMSRLFDSLEMNLEKKLKAVAAVLYGGARKRSDVERLMELSWKDLIAAIRIAQDERIGAVEVLDFLEQPIAA